MNPDDKISLRGKVWKILLQVGDIDYKNYIKLVSKGPVNNKELSETILKEKRLYAQRALRLTPDLFRRIPPEKLVRIPNALMHALRKCNLLKAHNHILRLLRSESDLRSIFETKKLCTNTTLQPPMQILRMHKE